MGGKSWLRENSVAIAAIFAAIVAATVAVMNQRMQLRHDRYLRNRDHMRDAIDNAIVVANEVRTAVDKFSVRVAGLEERRADMENDELDEKVDEVAQRQELVLTKLHAMRAARSRLEIRFDEHDAVLEEYQSALTAFVELSREINQGLADNRSEERREEGSEIEDEALSSLEAFQEACREWLADSGTKGRRSVQRAEANR